MDKPSKSAVRKAINSDFNRLEKSCSLVPDSGHRASMFLENAYEQALDGERKHRAMGRRWTNGQAKYRQPAEVAARYMVVRWVTDAGSANEIQPESLMELRLDVCYCRALRRSLTLAGRYPFTPQEPPLTEDFDYCEQIAERS